jgi:hypothetical protein
MGMVRHTFETMRKPSAEDWSRVEAIPDEAIDFSDIPEIKDFSGFLPVQEKKVHLVLTCDLEQLLSNDRRCQKFCVNSNPG